MGERLEREFEKCSKEGKIKKFSGAKGLSAKELKEADQIL